MKGIINRDLSADENYSGGPLPKGSVVYLYSGYCYGCIAPGGIAVSVVEDETPFFEIPEDSVTWERAK